MKNNETIQQEVVPVNEVMAVEQPVNPLTVIEQRNELFNRVLAAAIRETGPGDWINQNGKPYLTASGAEKIARRFAIRIFDTEYDREEFNDDKGKMYLYTVRGKACMAGSSNDIIDAIGTCDTRDAFFAKRKGQLLPIEDIDIGNIKKAAYSNFMMNAITHLLGIRNLTWDVLSQYGITKDGKQAVTYKSAKPKPAADPQAPSKDAPLWQNEYNGKTYMHARSGTHFAPDLLVQYGFKEGKTAGMFHRLFDTDVWDELTAAAAEVEASNG